MRDVFDLNSILFGTGSMRRGSGRSRGCARGNGRPTATGLWGAAADSDRRVPVEPRRLLYNPDRCVDCTSSSSRMRDFVTVAKVSSLGEGQGQTVVAGDKLVALFLDRGQYYAIDDLCPHMGASLGGGSICEGIVTCPWHAW